MFGSLSVCLSVPVSLPSWLCLSLSVIFIPCFYLLILSGRRDIGNIRDKDIMEEKITTKSVQSALVVTALVGNLLVCLVILKTRALRSPLYYLIMNLAIADLMIVISFTPRHILEGLYRHPRGTIAVILCKTITSDTFTWVGAVAASITLVVIAYERFAALTAPLENLSNFSSTKLKAAVVVSWVLAVIFNIPLFYVRGFNNERGFCESHWSNAALYVGYNVTWLVLIGLLPCCLMAFFYGKAIAQLRKKVVPRCHASVSVMETRKKVTKMLMAITAIYGICWIPNLIFYVVWCFYLHGNVMYTINEVFLVLLLVNSSINPIVYAAQNRLFRRRMVEILCGCKKLSENENATLSLSKVKNFTVKIEMKSSPHRKSSAKERALTNLEEHHSQICSDRCTPNMTKESSNVANGCRKMSQAKQRDLQSLQIFHLQ